MKFKAKFTTKDGRLTEGKIYQGGFVWRGTKGYGGLRVVVYDNKNEFMTFAPKAFEPAEAV
jgi:hypothetical protein